ncbi:bacteriophage holin, partial [candidate division KSB1 bacterium]
IKGGNKMKLNVKAFALACGITCGVGLFLITWWIIVFKGITEDLTFIGRVYFGYKVSPLGSIIGIPYAFVDGLIGGAVIAWLYNLMLKKPELKED